MSAQKWCRCQQQEVPLGDTKSAGNIAASLVTLNTKQATYMAPNFSSISAFTCWLLEWTRHPSPTPMVHGIGDSYLLDQCTALTSYQSACFAAAMQQLHPPCVPASPARRPIRGQEPLSLAGCDPVLEISRPSRKLRISGANCAGAKVCQPTLNADFTASSHPGVACPPLKLSTCRKPVCPSFQSFPMK